MQYTNKFNLPKPLVLLVTTDLYNKKRDAELRTYCSKNGLDVKKIKHFSASDLIKPPRMRVLTKRHWDKLITDVSAHIYRVLGQAIHYFLREAAIHGELEKEGWKAEERMFVHFVVDGQIIVISGEPDIVSPDNAITDYKVCAVWSWMKEAKREWKEQTNIYSYLRKANGLVTTLLEICYILRDFKLSEIVQEGYPQAGAQVELLEHWTPEEQHAYIMERIKLHLAAEPAFDDELPECSDEEMWAKEEAFAIKREGGKVASKVLTPKYAQPKEGESVHDALAREAEVLLAEMNAKPAIVKGKEKPYFVEHRPGERTRCLLYCDARTVCNQFQEYASAAFRGTPSREMVEDIQ